MIQKFLTMLVVLMMLVPSVIAAPNENANTKGLKITDLSKGTMKEVKDDKVKGIKTSSSDIVVDEKGKNHIKLKDSKPSKVPNEHKKVKVSFDSNELKSIDVDGDGKFSILEITDDGVVIDQYIATSAQLTSGIDMTFSEVEINGFSGYLEQTFTNVASGTVLDIDDVTDAENAIVTVSASGTIPTYAPIVDTNMSTYPSPDNIILLLPMYNKTDISGHSATTEAGVTYSADGKATFTGNGVNTTPASYIGVTTVPTPLTNFTIVTKGIGVYTGCTRPADLLLRSITTSAQFTKENIPVEVKGLTEVSYRTIFGTSNNTTSKVRADNMAPVTAAAAGAWTQTYPWTVQKYYSNNDKYIPGVVDLVMLYDKELSIVEEDTIYAMGSGVSFQPEPSDSFTGYNVASGVEKTLATAATCTGIEYMDTTRATRDITVKVYYTEDTTVSTETSTDDFYNASVVFSPSVDLSNGTIVRPIPPLYTGTAVLDSNNTNTVMTQNRTHYTIYTGTLTAGSWAGYNVSVPNNADHGMWLDIIMTWSATIQGWIFGETAPTDYTNDISDEITVTVS